MCAIGHQCANWLAYIVTDVVCMERIKQLDCLACLENLIYLQYLRGPPEVEMSSLCAKGGSLSLRSQLFSRRVCFWGLWQVIATCIGRSKVVIWDAVSLHNVPPYVGNRWVMLTGHTQLKGIHSVGLSGLSGTI